MAVTLASSLCQAISEFSALWLDSFDQATLPIDTIYVLLILAETSGYIPTQTPWLKLLRSGTTTPAASYMVSSMASFCRPTTWWRHAFDY